MEHEQELIELLSDSELEHFESLAPSYKKIFIGHVFNAKTEKTRLKNIDEVKEAMELKCKNIFDYKKKKNPRNEIAKDLDDATKIKLYFEKVEDLNNRNLVAKLYDDLVGLDENLNILYAWNNPMIKYKETFICGVTVAKAHFTLAFEAEALDFFRERIIENGYGMNLKTFKIKYNQEIDFELLSQMVLFSIELKKDAKGFWK
ncbi:YdeI/OmpD-associated family protein [Mollicutes bacterium LVI A0078]|nr:YdeI/OmpD-associated family protein [Mollicutes bacterium LVI A0075]WOO90714.1 YdeI/OmpD-associated family protein [Mollicutes bacterium LVI A0078]